MANPNDDTEWVEIYNTTNQTIDLSNWLIKDGNSLTNDDIILTGQINPFSFIVFDHNKRWLNDSGDETVTLLNNSNQPIDSYQYSGTTKGKTYGRQPDGENWIANLNPSKGSSNGSQAAPTIAPTPSPTLSPTPTPTPTPTSTPQPISSFTISSSQTQINADQILNVTINLTLTNKPNTKFFLKGAFRKPGSTNYFGYTKVNNNWIKNSSNYLEQYAITTDQTGNWTGNLEIKPDTEDKGYTGSDDYSLKVGKYDSTDSSPSVSWTNNELTIKISSVSNQDANTDTNSNSSTATPLPTPIATVLATNKTVSATKHPKITSQNATVAGIQKTASRPASPSANINVKNDRQFHPLILTGITLVLIGVGTIGYIYLKKNVKIPF